MSEPASSLLSTPIRLPEPGESVRLQKGRLELVLERVRGGWMLLCHDGHEGRRHFLGLPPNGDLVLAPRVPRYPVRVHLRDVVTLAAGGRLRVYILVPVTNALIWIRSEGEEEVLIEWLPRELHAEWVGEEDTCIHHSESPLLTHPAAARLDSHVLVPTVLHNRSGHRATPGELPVQLHDAELRELRGRLMAAPRRMLFDDEGAPREVVRPWSRVGVPA